MRGRIRRFSWAADLPSGKGSIHLLSVKLDMEGGEMGMELGLKGRVALATAPTWRPTASRANERCVR